MHVFIKSVIHNKLCKCKKASRTSLVQYIVMLLDATIKGLPTINNAHSVDIGVVTKQQQNSIWSGQGAYTSVDVKIIIVKLL